MLCIHEQVSVTVRLMLRLIHHSSSPFLCVTLLQLCLKLKIDDPVNASGVHFYAGMWGLLTPALFATSANMNNAYGIDGYVGLFNGGG